MRITYIRVAAFVLCCMLGTVTASACDVCGCGIGGPANSLAPFMDKSLIAVRIRTTSTESHLTYGPRFRTQEQFTRAELTARINVTDRFMLTASIPWAKNQQSYMLSGDSYDKTGIGDVIATALYALYIQPAEDSALGISVLGQLGSSIPTGAYTYSSTQVTDVSNANFQTGSGSTDLIAGLTSTVRTQEYGARLASIIRVPTTNPYGYRFGTSSSTSASVFYNIDMGSDIMAVPSAGVIYDYMWQNSNAGEKVDVTGGYITWASLSGSVRISSILLDIQLDVPVKQFQGGGALSNDMRGTITLGYLL